MNAPAVHHEPERRRFSLAVAGGSAELDYRLDAQCMVIPHTRVSPALRGQGLAARLVAAAVAEAQAQGWQAAAECSYAAAWLARHPDTGGQPG